jgi:hypothetical protein
MTTSTAYFVETATAECPVSSITVSGVADTATLEALTTAVQDYSDGYRATIDITNSGLFASDSTTGVTQSSVLLFAFGRGEVSATRAEFGAVLSLTVRLTG